MKRSIIALMLGLFVTFAWASEETELSKAMPHDFKDWWQNSKQEWPVVARLVIENLREREQSAWEALEQQK